MPALVLFASATALGQMQSLFSKVQFFDSTKGREKCRLRRVSRCGEDLSNASNWRFFGVGRRLTEPGQSQTFAMTPENYPVVGSFKNETAFAMTLYLEMVPEEVILEAGDEVELLAQPTDNLLPLDVVPVESGLHIHAHKECDPDWHVRFRGRVIKIGNPTRLSDYR